MDYIGILLIVCCVTFYYRVGEQEYGSGILLALISITLWLIGSFVLGFGRLGSLLVQVGLFFGLAFWKMARRDHK